MSGLSEFGKYLSKFRIDKGMVLGDMANKIKMSTVRLSAIQNGAVITGEELKILISRYPEIRSHMSILYHAIGLDKHYNEIKCVSKFYFSRNRFCVSCGDDLKSCTRLLELGYMENLFKSNNFQYFKVSKKGLKLLSCITGVEILLDYELQ